MSCVSPASNNAQLLCVISDVAGERDKNLIKPAANSVRGCSISKYPARVTISCPEKRGTSSKLVLLPESLQQLLNIGAKKFQFCPTKVLTTEGAEVEDIELVRDGDHLVLVGDGAKSKIQSNIVGH